MSKRNKGEHKDNNTKIKKKKTYTANEDVLEEISSIQTTGNGKNTKIVFENDEDLSKVAQQDKITKDLNTNLPIRKNLRRNKKNTENEKAQNKKLIFRDDDDDGTKVTVKKGRKKKSPREEEPLDAEIDKFCDELDEEDNVQYDNWVKLIEAKLGSSKK